MVDQEINLDRKTVFSPHNKFDPKERIKFRFSRKFMDCFEDYKNFDDLVEYLDEMYRGKFKIGNNFFFPNNQAMLRFRNSNIMRVSVQDLNILYNSIRRQDMTTEEIYEFSLRMASVWSLIFRKKIEIKKFVAGFYFYSFKVMKKIAFAKGNAELSNINLQQYLQNIEYMDKFIFLPVSLSVSKLRSAEFDFSDYYYARKDLFDLVTNFRLKLKQNTIDLIMEDLKIDFVFPSGKIRKLPKRTYEFVGHLKVDLDFDYSISEQFIMQFIETLENTGSISDSFKSSIQWLKSNNMPIEEIRRIVLLMVDINPIDYFDKYLYIEKKNLLKTKRKFEDWIKYKQTQDQIEFVNVKGKLWKNYARSQQAVASQWASFFKLHFGNRFYTLSNVLCLMADVCDKEGLVFCSTDEVPETSAKSRHEDDTNVLDQGLEDIKELYGDFKNHFATVKEESKLILNNCLEGTKSFKDSMSKLDSVFDKFHTGLSTSPNLKNLVSESISFSSISSGLGSLKMLVNSIFQGLVSKVFEVLQLGEPKNLPDFSYLLLVYMVWVNTESKTLKILLMLDLAASMGVFDMIIRVVKDFWSMVSNKLGTIFTSLDEFLEKKKKKIQTKYEKVTEPIAKLQEAKESLESEVHTDMNSWAGTILDLLTRGGPFVLGALAIALLGKSYKGCKKETTIFSVGNDIFKMAKNLSYLSLGLAAIPKIFENIILVFSYVVDYTKKLINKEHKTKIDKRNHIINFLKEANYMPGFSQVLFASDPIYCFTFLKHYTQLPEMREIAIDLKDANITRFYTDIEKKMGSMYNFVRSCLKMFSSTVEPIHIQMYSNRPGVGKTDTVSRLVQVAKKTLQKTAMTLDLKDPQITDIDLIDNGVMYFNDLLSYADNYQYQPIGIVDETDVFKTTPPEVIIQKMMLLSGNPCIVNKAALEDKGMMFETKVLFSSTNNLFPIINDMITVNAYYRRRKVFSVNPKKIFINEENDTIDWDKVDRTVNRTRCEHLEYQWLEESHTPDSPPNGTPKKDMPEVMDIEQLEQLIAILIEEHAATEEERLLEKNPMAYTLRKHLEYIHVLMKSMFKIKKDNFSQKILVSLEKVMEDLVAKNKIKLQVEQIVDDLRDYINRLVFESEINPDVFLEIKEFFENNTLCNLSERQILKILNFLKSKLTNLPHDGRDCSKVESSERDDSDDELLGSDDETVIEKSKWKCSACYCEELEALIVAFANVSHIKELDPILDKLNLLGVGNIVQQTSDVDNLYYNYELQQEGKYYSLYRVDNKMKVYKSWKGLDISKFEFKKSLGKWVYVCEDNLSKDIEDKILSFLVYYNDLYGHDSKQMEKLQREYQIKEEYAQGKWALKERSLKIGSAIMDGVKWVASKVFDYLSDVFRFMIFYFSALASFFVLFSIGQVLCGVQATSYSDKQRFQPSIQKKAPPPITIVKTTSSYEPNLRYDYVTDIKCVQKMMFKLFLLCDDGLSIRSRCTAVSLGGSAFMAPRHFFDKFEKTENCALYDHKRATYDCKPIEKFFRFQINKKDIIPIDHADAVVFEIKGFRAVLSAEKHFLKEEDLENNCVNFSFASATALHLREKTPFKTLTDFPQGRLQYEFGDTGYHPTVLDERFNHRAGYDHVINRVFRTTPPDSKSSIIQGDSGAPVLHGNVKMQSRFILGVAFCKDDMIFDSFYTCVVTQEQIAQAKSKLPFSTVVETCYYDAEPLSEDHRLYDVFENKAYLRKSPYPSLDIGTSPGFKKSPVYGVFPVESEPAIQSDKDPRIPKGERHFLKVSLNKYNGDTSFFITKQQEKQMLYFIEKIYKSHFYLIIPTLRVYTPREAITGIRMIGSTPINYHSSAGLPYSLEPGVKGKTPFIRFSEEHKSIYVQDRVYFDTEYMEESYLRGKVPYNTKSEYNKKELVGRNKIEQPKTRTVATGNFVHQIIYNRVNKDLFTKIKNMWNQQQTSPFAVGIDMEKHANLIAEHIRWHDYVFDFDVKAWEKSVNLQLCEMVITNRAKLVKLAYSWRGEKLPYDVEKMMQSLTIDFIDTDVAYSDVLFHKNSGLLSGHPGTFMENSDIHAMLICQIVFEITQKHNCGFKQNTILENIRFLVAADDIILSVSPLLRQFVTSETLKEGYAMFGFNITASDKTENISVKTFYECQFLKHTFRQETDNHGKTFIIAEPLTTIIYQLFNWINTESKLGTREQFLVNVENAFRFSYWRGIDFYESVRDRFNHSAGQIGIHWNYDFSEMESHILQSQERERFLLEAANPAEKPMDLVGTEDCDHLFL